MQGIQGSELESTRHCLENCLLFSLSTKYLLSRRVKNQNIVSEQPLKFALEDPRPLQESLGAISIKSWTGYSTIIRATKIWGPEQNFGPQIFLKFDH